MPGLLDESESLQMQKLLAESASRFVLVGSNST